MFDKKTSLLISRQVPEFVRDEYPKFVNFLEAYYEFLENKQTGKNNDLLAKSQDLRYVSDVDYSIDAFEDQFLNTFASLLPKDISVDKAFLIKNLLPLYLAKGNEKSFKLLFRMIFDEEVEVIQPKNSILRASDGKWLIEKAFRISQDVYSYYTANGNTSSTAVESGNTVFQMAQVAGSEEIAVYVDGVLQTSGYNVRRESKKEFETSFNPSKSSSHSSEMSLGSKAKLTKTQKRRDQRNRQKARLIEKGVQCHYCDAWLTEETFSWDHIVPKVSGGGNNKKNKIPACKQCNNDKSDKPYETFTNKPLPVEYIQ